MSIKDSQAFIQPYLAFYGQSFYTRKEKIKYAGTQLIKNIRFFLLAVSIGLITPVAHSQLILEGAPEEVLAIAGSWIINEELSDNTDRQVEVALRAAGERIQRRLFSIEKDRYRGGPAEQELYDHISYDKELTIVLTEPEFSFIYDEGFQRPVYTDNRSLSVSLSRVEEIEDFSFAHWENNKLLVEARPRDGGFAEESYSLITAGTQLKVELYIKPRVFQIAIEIVRIYDRKTENPAPDN